MYTCMCATLCRLCLFTEVSMWWFGSDTCAWLNSHSRAPGADCWLAISGLSCTCTCNQGMITCAVPAAPALSLSLSPPHLLISFPASCVHSAMFYIIRLINILGISVDMVYLFTEKLFPVYTDLFFFIWDGYSEFVLADTGSKSYYIFTV